MIILRVFLYLACIISIGWSVLVFVGPPIIKRFISVYSNGALTPYDVTISPGLDIRISRLEFNFQNEITGQHLEGFSRAVEIAWSLFSEKPFLEINLGPSLVKNYATAETVDIYTPSFQEIDWQNIAFAANIKSLVMNSFAKTNTLTLEGDINVELFRVSNIIIKAKDFSAKDDNSTYFANFIRSDLSELNLNVPLTSNLFSSTHVIEGITVSQPNLNIPDAVIEISVEEEAKKFKIDLHDVEVSEVGGFIENLKVDGHFNQLNILQELHIASTDSMPFKKSPKFPEILVNVKKLGDELYEANIEGNLEEFELSDSDNFIGILPGGNFVIDTEIDREASTVTSVSGASFSTSGKTNIFGTAEMKFNSELLTNLRCASFECDLTDFNLSYKINFDDEWVKGSANCRKNFCGLAEIDHLIKTSNTVNVFTILNKENILNPLTALYLFGAISSGQKINEGHELKFQF